MMINNASLGPVARVAAALRKIAAAWREAVAFQRDAERKARLDYFYGPKVPEPSTSFR